MMRFSTLCIASVAGIMMIAPGMVQTSFAEGSAFDQRKATDEQRAYRAYSTDGMDTLVRTAPPAVETGPSDKMWPGVPGIAPAEKIVPWKNEYVMPRGGREY